MEVEIEMAVLFFAWGQDEEIVAYEKFLSGLKRDELIYLYLQARQGDLENYGEE